MWLQKSRSYLINDWLCNCCFEARRAPPSAMGFLDDLGASGLMWTCRACHGTQCLIHQLPPAQSSRSIPAPTPGPLPWGPGLGTTLPGLCSLQSSPKMLAFPCPMLGSQRGSFRGLLRGRAGGPCVLGPCWPPPAPHHPLHPHTFPWQGAHRPPAGTTALAPSVSKFPLMLPDSASPRWNAKCVPERCSPVLEAGPCHPYQYLPLPVHALASPPTRCLGGLCPLRDPGAQDGTLWS